MIEEMKARVRLEFGLGLEEEFSSSGSRIEPLAGARGSVTER